MITEWQEEMDQLYEMWKSHTARHQCLDTECKVRHAIVYARSQIEEARKEKDD
jgi:hypothetical protein